MALKPLDNGERHAPLSTADAAYARQLAGSQSRWWKRVLPVQAPYRWNLRRQRLGRTLDIGCGPGRNLAFLGADAVGVDHNPQAVAIARRRGLNALTVAEWPTSPWCREGSFDSLLLAHVLEHLDEAEAVALLASYLPCLRSGGTVFLICPQEAGFASDATHVRFVDGPAMQALAERAGLQPARWFSFPFPRGVGRLFPYNEFCLRAIKP